MLKNLKEVIMERHSCDDDQLKVIFSEDKSIVVTAPAGCGKTTTMISKIAWELSSNHVSLNKKILAITYSVAGAMKIRDSLRTLLPELIDHSECFLDRVDVSNYHQFSMKILNKYGYVLNPDLSDLYSFDILDEDSRSVLPSVTGKELDTLISFKNAVKNSDEETIKSSLDLYWDVLQKRLIPNKKITYNGLIVSAIMLLHTHHEIAEFYQKYYQMVIVDEFQDTNYLGFFFLKELIGENRTVFLGDDIQRIYGFIGAVHDLFSVVKNEYSSEEFCFRTNYRFPENPEIKELDMLFRSYGENYQASNLTAKLSFRSFNSDAQETAFVFEGISCILERTEDKVAVLVRAGYQGDSIAKKLTQEGISFFNCLYKESDIEYERFYDIAVEEFHKTNRNNKALIKNLKLCLGSVMARKDEIITEANRTFVFDSLYRLLEILFDQSRGWDCTPEERYAQIDFSLGNKGLKYMMEYMNERVILSTIHGAKGLEWQYVIVPGLVSYSFPASPICKECKNIYSNCTYGYDFCKCNFMPGMEKHFKEEISVFYVALTRAKKEVFFTASNGNNPWGYPKKTSCFITLPGVVCEEFSWKKRIDPIKVQG